MCSNALKFSKNLFSQVILDCKKFNFVLRLFLKWYQLQYIVDVESLVVAACQR